MAYTISTHDSIQVLEVKSLFNEFDNRIILQEVNQYMEKGFDKLVIDLSHLDFMNSVGLNFLLSLMSKSRNNGSELTLASASDQVIGLLEMTKLRNFFRIRGSVEEAMDSFGEN